MLNVLITGSSGFMGSKLCEFFDKHGYNVIGWDRYQISDKCIDFYPVDMLDYDNVIANLRKIMPDIIIHCAGSADVSKSVKFPEIDYAGNVTITHNLLFALHKLHIENTRVVFLSSASVYGNPQKIPITEDMSVNPLSPYALHKVMCEDICSYFFKNYGMDIKVARIFSAYGAGLKKQIFWDMYNKAKKTGKLEMFGTGNESRDYIHVDDVVQSLYFLVTTDSEDMVFNVANGEEVTIRKVTELFADRVGIEKENIYFNGVVREGDPLNWEADIQRMKCLGYKQSVQIEDGIDSYFNWVRSL